MGKFTQRFGIPHWFKRKGRPVRCWLRENFGGYFRVIRWKSQRFGGSWFRSAMFYFCGWLWRYREHNETLPRIKCLDQVIWEMCEQTVLIGELGRFKNAVATDIVWCVATSLCNSSRSKVLPEPRSVRSRAIFRRKFQINQSGRVFAIRDEAPRVHCV